MLEKEFEQLLVQYSDLIPVRSRFVGLVRDYFPGQQMQINLIIAAYDLGIAKDIEQVNNINNAFAYRFVKRLIDEYGISRANADWVVSVWCVCYGNRVLKKPCEIKISSGKSGAVPAIADEKSGNGKYGDLFQYERSSYGDGLAVTGFCGENKRMIIFQNAYNNNHVVEIKAEAFAEDTLEEAILAEGIRRIGDKAFYGSTLLKQVILPSSLKEIGNYAFAGCSGIKSFSLPATLEQIGEFAFSGIGVKALSIPKTVYWIGAGALSQCTQLESIDIKENIDVIPEKLFYGCSALTKVNLHERLTNIGASAFENCSSLTTINIPDSVTAIGDNAFAGTSENFILLCSFGSFAESYARKNKLKYQLI